MGAATTGLERATTLFRALADPTRLGILEQLRDGERCVCELMDALDSAQSRLSFHLKTLKDAGLVDHRREGRWVYYSLNPEAVAVIEAVVASLHPSGRRRAAARCC